MGTRAVKYTTEVETRIWGIEGEGNIYGISSGGTRIIPRPNTEILIHGMIGDERNARCAFGFAFRFHGYMARTVLRVKRGGLSVDTGPGPYRVPKGRKEIASKVRENVPAPKERRKGEILTEQSKGDRREATRVLWARRWRNMTRCPLYGSQMGRFHACFGNFLREIEARRASARLRAPVAFLCNISAVLSGGEENMHDHM